MAEQQADTACGNVVAGPVQVVHFVVMGVVYSGQVNPGLFPFQWHHFIHQQPVAHVFQCRNHAHAVVVAQHRVGVSPDRLPELFHARQGGIYRAPGALAIIAGQYAQIVVQWFNLADDGLQVLLVHIHVQVGQVQYPETFKGLGQVWQHEAVVGGSQFTAVALGPVKQTDRLQAKTDETRRIGEVFQVK